MSASTHKTLFAVLGAASIFAIGCVGQTTPESEDQAESISAALQAENGGMTTANESAAFSDPKFAQVPDLEALPELEPPDLSNLGNEIMAQPGARVYTIALLWGHLPAARDAQDGDADPQVIDWTGRVTVDRGAIKLDRALKFDRRDRIAPRTDPQVVAFRSHTLPHVDGLFLTVAVPALAPTTLHFDTAALKADIDLAQMAVRGGGVERLGDGRNGLAYIGFQNQRDCARGLAFGRWNKVRARLGHFRGRVVDARADVIGHVKGIWGHAPKRDANVFFGKYISKDGEHRGLFGGTYADGQARGVWGTRDPRNAGVLQVWYSDGYEKDDGRGVWLGRWSERCAD